MMNILTLASLAVATLYSSVNMYVDDQRTEEVSAREAADKEQTDPARRRGCRSAAQCQSVIRQGVQDRRRARQIHYQ